jgi:AcrR family transcriptional regulator
MAKTAASPARKPRSRYHHGDLRHALLVEAVRTIGEEGVAGLTLREVGKRLGVSRTALYRHFSDKSSLLAAVARDGFQRFAADLRQGWIEGGQTRRGLDLMGVAYVRFAVANPSHYRVMFGDYRRLCAKDPDLEADAAAAFDVLLQALIALQTAGDIRPDEPLRQAHFVWAIVHGIASLAIDGQLGPETSAPQGLTGLVDFALARMRTGIGAGARD